MAERGRGRGRGGGRGNPRASNPTPNSRANGNGSVAAAAAGVDQLSLAGSSGGGGARGAGALRHDNLEEGRRAKLSTFLEKSDYVFTKQHTTNTKVGQLGRPVTLTANYYGFSKTDFCVFAYWVDFKPEQKNTVLQKGLLGNHAKQLGTFIFDGRCLWTAQRLQLPLVMCSTSRQTEEVVEMTVKLVGECDPGDPARLQFYNIIRRNCQGPNGLKLVQIRRNSFDPDSASEHRLEAHRVEIWRGYITTLRQFENNLLLNVCNVHKILRTNHCWETMQGIMRGSSDFNENTKRQIREVFVGAIVMTRYNNKWSKIDDINFSLSPSSTFPKKDGSEMSYIEYYRVKHSQDIKSRTQPLFLSSPKAKDFHRGETKNIYLVPELCFVTGLTEGERADHRFMKEINQVTQQQATQKMNSIQAFIDRLGRNVQVRAQLGQWGMEYSSNPVKVPARILPPEEILMKAGEAVKYLNSDWKNCFQSDTRKGTVASKMAESMRLDKWIVIVTARDRALAHSLVANMIQVATPLGFVVAHPLDVKVVPDPRRIDSYLRIIKEASGLYGKLDLIMVILPIKSEDVYGPLKRECCSQRVTSQFVVARTLEAESKLLSVVTKVVIQINAKLGGQPWTVKPFFTTPNMVIGFDVFHGKGQDGRCSVAAMVATTNRGLSTYYSTTSKHDNREEISSKMATNIIKCVNAFRSKQNILPKKIVFFRDGVGEGQLHEVVNTELKEIQGALRTLYENEPPPCLTFIVTTKRINTRVYEPNGEGGFSDPQPGTIVDDVITQPERFDFYLISNKAPKNQGSVTPTAYNVIWDDNKLTADQIQQYTFKLTHAYFNWTGSVSVPAVNQYAHKLAFLVGKYGLSETAVEEMAHSLFYL